MTGDVFIKIKSQTSLHRKQKCLSACTMMTSSSKCICQFKLVKCYLQGTELIGHCTGEQSDVFLWLQSKKSLTSINGLFFCKSYILNTLQLDCNYVFDTFIVNVKLTEMSWNFIDMTALDNRWNTDQDIT